MFSFIIITVFPLKNLSNGTLTFDSGKNEINANIQIINGTAVTATLSLYSINAALTSLFDLPLFMENSLKPRSFTIVHIPNVIRSSYYQNAIGRRQPADELLYFRSKIASNMNRFAQTDFEFIADTKQVITCVGFSFDVSLCVF